MRSSTRILAILTVLVLAGLFVLIGLKREGEPVAGYASPGAAATLSCTPAAVDLELSRVEPVAPNPLLDRRVPAEKLVSRRGVIAGTVASPLVGLVRDAKVHLIYDRVRLGDPEWHDPSVRPSFAVTTDGSGSFEFVTRIAGTVSLVVSHAGHLTRHTDLGDIDPTSLTPPLAIALDPGARIQGTVLAPDGATVEGALVTAMLSTGEAQGSSQPLWSSRSDPMGRFLISGLLEGRHSLTANHSSVKARTTRSGEVVARTQGTWLQPRMTALTGSEDVLLQFGLGFELRGRVVDAHSSKGTFVCCARVDDQGRPVRSMSAEDVSLALVDADGSFLITGLAPGRWDLLAERADGSHSGIVMIRIDGDTRGIEIELGRSSTIRGLVRADSGTPSGTAKVLLWCSEQVHVGHTHPHLTTVRPDGTFEIAGCPVGVAELRAEWPGIGSSLPFGVTLREGEVVEDVELLVMENGQSLPFTNPGRIAIVAPTVLRGR